jgi:large repetitive protein
VPHGQRSLLPLLPLLLVACPGPDTSIIARANEGPEVIIWSPASGEAFDEDESISFTGTVEDDRTSPDEIHLAWTSSVDGTLEEGYLAQDEGLVALVIDDLSLGEHVIRLRGADADNVEGSDEITISVGRTEAFPSIEILHPDGDEQGSQGLPFDLEALVEDPQDLPEDLLVSMASDLDGDLCLDLQPTPAGIASCAVVLSVAPDLSEGIADPHRLTFTVVDSDDNFVTAEVDLAVESDLAVDNDLDGYSEDEGDCDDTDPYVFPGADEVCNGVDDDCDGDVDDDDRDVLDASTWYRDRDGDGYGVDDDTVAACDQPSGYAAYGGDCDDADTAYNPGASEEDCTDPADYNCDGSSGYIDGDGDGWAACEDCDDGDATVNPDALEHCDGADDDCDGSIDEADAVDAPTWYGDGDGDGYGNSGLSQVACSAPSGYVAGSSDCDDGDAAIHPGATETCDGDDNDCDGLTDDDDPGLVGGSTWYADADGDGYGDPSRSRSACSAPSGYVADSSDCDDGDAGIHPGATEVCDGDDNDCDGLTDDDDGGVVGTSTWYRDQDGDSYGDSGRSTSACTAPSGYVADSSDCDDNDASAYPGAAELCDGTDNDCDGTTDESDAADASTWYGDGDGDGYGNASLTQRACSAPSGYVSDSSDCDDGDAGIHPGATEVCDGDDNDCDGLTDDDDSGVVGTSTYYRDRDGDGYGLSSSSSSACTAPSGYVTDATDCDDGDAGIHPGATEVCDGDDNDCDGLTDDDDPGVTGTSTWYRDNDSDGYGDITRSTAACAAPRGYIADSSDCDDYSAAVHPGATETCDGDDNDCDGLIDDDDSGVTGTTTLYADSDGDGYGDPATSIVACSGSSGWVSNSSDCYDGNADANPAQAGYFTTDRGDGSYDYDCNGVNDAQYTSAGSCGGWPACTTYAGWTSHVRACGVTANYITSCNTSLGACSETTESRTQACR